MTNIFLNAEKNRYLTLLILLFLTLSACSGDQETGPSLIEVSSDEDIKPEDILKITNKYLSKPFLSIYGNKKICNEIYKLWIKNN